MNEVYDSRYGIPFIDLTATDIADELLGLFPPSQLNDRGFVPFAVENGELCVAIANPHDLDLPTEIKLRTGKKIRTFLADPKEIAKALKQRLGVGSTAFGDAAVADDPFQSEDLEDSSGIDDLGEQRIVSKLVDELLIDALQMGASDVHLECEEDHFQIRYRVDGLLMHVSTSPNISQYRSAIVSRIKILSKLNIAERRLPQDGRFKSVIGTRETDVRVSVIPMLHGENVVMRLLDRGRKVLGIEELEIPEFEEKKFLDLIRSPNGMVLITGPTGSGKTTTLYSALNAIKDSRIKIVTIEDPVEYSLPGIHQIQVHEKIGRTFAKGLRSVLRHDPDVVLVGEIRDHETAQSAVQASLTGHLVFSTLHTNDACGALPRLVDMGVEPYLVAGTLSGVMAQRLARRLCPSCKAPKSISALDTPEDFPASIAQAWVATGCRQCQQTGYAGRLPIFELLVLDQQVTRIALTTLDPNAIRDQAVSNGMRTLRQSGWAAVSEGKTTIEEVLRLTTISNEESE
ncbi:MAG: GspE/PulE family protein [Planctomycetaceae bacterium]|nr:GspE/PulE family protein [Planctomycetaceae bacterium]